MKVGLKLKKDESIQDLAKRYEVCRQVFELNKDGFDPEERAKESVKLDLFRAWIRHNGMEVI